jgi:hypothetical protein
MTDLPPTPQLTPHHLLRFGETTYADRDDWKACLARDLGQYHPRGPRDGLDVRLVRRWVSGERPTPTWLPAALCRIAQRYSRQARQRANDIDDVVLLFEVSFLGLELGGHKKATYPAGM